MDESCRVWMSQKLLFKSARVIWSTGWRRRIGRLRLQVSFCTRVAHYRALSQKMTYKDKASYASSPPCTKQRLCYWVKSYDSNQHESSEVEGGTDAGCLIFIGHLPQKSPMISDSCAERACKCEIWRSQTKLLGSKTSMAKTVLFNRSRVTYERHMNESCLTYERARGVMSQMPCHIWMSHVTWVNDMTYPYVTRHSYLTWAIHMWHESRRCRCNTLQYTATHCNTLQHTATVMRICEMHQDAVAATHCNTLQHAATRCNSHAYMWDASRRCRCNTLQHTATRCNTLQ